MKLKRQNINYPVLGNCTTPTTTRHPKPATAKYNSSHSPTRPTKTARPNGGAFIAASILGFSYIISILVITTFAKHGAQATSATNSLTSDRVHIVRQQSSSPSRQSKQPLKEKNDRIVIHVKENTPIGTRLTEIQPRDSDIGQVGGSSLSGQGHFHDSETIYAIVGGTDARSFTLIKDERDGKVELVNEVNFDYESDKKIYYVAIRALSVYFRYDLDVDIVVEDENDNKPQLDDFAIVFNNYKNHFPTGPIGRVPATDLDLNDALHYRVLSGNAAQLIIVNETNGDIQLSPWLNSNVPLDAVMDVAVSDGINDAVAKLTLAVNLVTETMLHNSVTVRLDGLTRDEFFSRKYDIFQTQMARILGTRYITHVVVFDVEESHHNGELPPEAAGFQSGLSGSLINGDSNSSAASSAFRVAYNQHSTITNTSLYYVNVSFSARANDNDAEAYLSRQYIEERIFLNRLMLSQNLEAQIAPFQDDVCVQEPCLNYQECQVTYKFDKAPRTFLTHRNMIFRQVKANPSFTCLCPATFTGMKNKLECNLQINQCFKNPCLNGGQCHRHESGYTCECRGEFFGPQCEHSFTNSTCQSLTATRTKSHLSQPAGCGMVPSSLNHGYPSIRHSSLSAGAMCSGSSKCVDLNKSQKQNQKSASSPSFSISAASGGITGFECQGCPYQSQWSNDLCQLRARSFEKHSYIVLPSLKRRHRFHLMLQFSTFQTDALLLYNGRYNDKHDFIALEIVDSRLRFSYNLGQNGQVSSVSIASIPVSDGQWHKVAVDYRDRNVTLILDECDPVLDEALARLQPNSFMGRCSNKTVSTVTYSTGGEQPTGNVYQMLDLTSPMQIGSIPPNLLDSFAVSSPDLILAGGSSGASGSSVTVASQKGEQSSMAYLTSLTNSFSGCISDLYVDHQLVDLSCPLQDVGTQPGCPDRRGQCQLQSCNGHPCQESYGAAKCQCSEERIGKSCELVMSPARVRKFTGNSYLAFNPVEAQIPNQWQVSLHFRTLNPSGILFKIFLEPEASILLEVVSGGLKLTHRSRSLIFNKIPMDDGEWHFVELTWSTLKQDLLLSTTTTLKVDYNSNLQAQSSDMGQVSGSMMRFVVVGFSSTRFTPYGSPTASLTMATASPDGSQSPAAPDGSAEYANNLLSGSTAPPPANIPPMMVGGTSGDEFAYPYGMAANASSQSFVGCIFGLNMSDNAEWWESPYDERNVERGCPVADPCETKQCPPNSFCIRKGVNQRRCQCNPGFVGEFCVPVCDLQPCQGDNSKCVPASSGLANMTAMEGRRSSLAPLEPAQSYTCECEPNRSGKNCEHQLNAKCPSNYRSLSSGQNTSCEPCNCDESKGFDGDCDRLTGHCFCKPYHYRPPGSDHCLACDCYSVGSLSTSCNQTTGQCKCREGVVGRRCETCASQYAEVTLRGCEVTYDLACPKTYSDGIWWEKTQLDREAEQQCPASTSTGTAFRYCHKTEGWQKAKLFDCISNTFTDLYTQYKFLEENKFQMTTDLAVKIASNLRLALNETISSPSMQLYGSDMYISFRLLHHLMQHETRQTGLNLTHRQDRGYIRNVVESISYILDPNYADNWVEIAKRSPNGGAEYLLKLVDSFGKMLIAGQSDINSPPRRFEIVTKHLTFGMDTLSIDKLYDMNKWSLGANLLAGHPSGAGHFPSSPPYATDPFKPFGPVTIPAHKQGVQPFASDLSASDNFNPDGTSVYLDFSATRDSSPSVIIPKYDNYPSSAGEFGDQMQHTQSKIFIPLKTLRMRQPKEIFGGNNGGSTWGIAAAASSAARSRAKRDELALSDHAGIHQPVVVYSIYKTIGPLLPNQYDTSVQNRLGNLAMVNSPVVWLTIKPQNSSEFLNKSIQPKITYMLKMVEPAGKTRPQCAIWDFMSPSQSAGSSSPAAQKNSTGQASSDAGSPAYGLKQTGRFTTRGCEIRGVHPNHRLKLQYVNCSCDHLGAVAVLMDNSNGNHDYLSSDESASLREMLLVLTLSLSLFVMTATLFVLTCIRGHSIKSNSNSINKNLIIILVIIELLFLYSALTKGSLNQREYQCKLIAIFLHYFSISLFFWLLVNAIHFYRMLTELRDINHGPMKFYQVLGYAVPAFFVSIAVGLRIEQFGNYLFCWLSIHEPIIWSMFGPISVVSMLTIILFKFAFCKSLPLNKMVDNQEDPNGVDLIRTHMLINCLKTPLIGIYWLIAVYAINESLTEYAYVFPMAIIIKSVVLFVLFCLVDKHIRYNLYVSWLRFKGEKVPFVDDSLITYGQYGFGAGSAPAVNNGSQQWMISMMNSMGQEGPYGHSNAAAGFGDMKNQTGQMLYPNQQQHHQVLAPGFQSSCTDIFRPELLDGLSAASTTSRSSASETSSSAYRDYRRSASTYRKVAANDDELDGPEELDDYGRSRRHRRRHGKKSHRKHHHHSGRHHHHHHHHHHRHRSHHQDDYEVNSRDNDGEQEAADYGAHQSHAAHHHHHHHHRNHRRRSARHSSHHQYQDRPGSSNRTNDSNHDSLDNILNNEQLLASSHSSDRDDVSSRVEKPKTAAPAAKPDKESVREAEQTVPMEIVAADAASPSTSGPPKNDDHTVAQEGDQENSAVPE